LGTSLTFTYLSTKDVGVDGLPYGSAQSTPVNIFAHGIICAGFVEVRTTGYGTTLMDIFSYPPTTGVSVTTKVADLNPSVAGYVEIDINGFYKV
jgi:hypothetical protein